MPPMPELSVAFRILSGGKRVDALKKFISLIEQAEMGELPDEAIDLVVDTIEKVNNLFQNAAAS